MITTEQLTQAFNESGLDDLTKVKTFLGVYTAQVEYAAVQAQIDDLRLEQNVELQKIEIKRQELQTRAAELKAKMTPVLPLQAPNR